MMPRRPRTLANYMDAAGREPFRDWLNSLKDRQGLNSMRTRLNRIRQDGNFGDWKSVGDGVFELRIDVGPGYRVYFAEDAEDDKLILLFGGPKKKQAADIAKSKKYWEDYNA